MKSSLLLSLKRLTDKRARTALVDSHLRNGIAFQIRSMRRGSNWTQEDLAREAGTKPTQITRIENPSYGSHTVATLRRIAAAFDVALVVRFVPYSELLRWDAGPRNLAPKPFWQELQEARSEDASTSAISFEIGASPRNVWSIQTQARINVGPSQATLFTTSSGSTVRHREIEELPGGTYAETRAV